MIRCCICDDKNEDVEAIKTLAADFSSEHPEIPLTLETFESPHDLLEKIRICGGYDLYLLDIIMPHMSGIELARKIRERGEAAEILFLTISREYAVEAFGVRASGYLLKPVKKADFDQEVLRCAYNLSPKENPAILLKTRDGIRKVLVQEIVMIESFNHVRVFSMSDGTVIETPTTLLSLYEQLREFSCFFVPHRAYIVNFAYVNGLTTRDLKMSNGKYVPVSRGLYRKLKEAYVAYAFKKKK